MLGSDRKAKLNYRNHNEIKMDVVCVWIRGYVATIFVYGGYSVLYGGICISIDHELTRKLQTDDKSKLNMNKSRDN